MPSSKRCPTLPWAAQMQHTALARALGWEEHVATLTEQLLALPGHELRLTNVSVKEALTLQRMSCTNAPARNC